LKSTRRQFGQFAASSLLLRSTNGVAAFLHSITSTPLQPFAAQAQRLADALAAVGSPLNSDELARLQRASLASDAEDIASIVSVLDRHVLMEVRINPEARLSVSRGAAPANLVQGGWSAFLVKVINEAAATSPLIIRSPQGGATGRRSSLAVEGVHDFSNGAVDAAEARARWIALNNYDLPPLTATLSGLPLEYRLLQVYSRDPGLREASLIADAGFGEQDLGFRSTLPILFHCAPAVAVKLTIRDEQGRPVTASLLIRDSMRRIYPAQGKRDLPDLAFEPQVYRSHGESLQLSPGDYTVDFGRGPEYLRARTTLRVGSAPAKLNLELKRWVDPSRFGYYSGDTHIHAAGCSHYESPTEGVSPEVMARQVAGEALDLGSVLNWGPGFAYQRRFFSGHAIPATTHRDHIMQPSEETAPATIAGNGLLRYDVEVSGFPSSHCGHLVLLRLQQDTYPGTATIEDWPSWNLPILQWAKSQGAVTGYAHVGHGMVTDTTELPNYVMPPFNSSGANEFLVDITHPGSVDFLSGCDLWPFAELNVWYHTLNCGLRSAFAGETDFPCITDECVGGGRSYASLPNGAPLGDEGYSAWLQALVAGDAYFGDGRSHIFNMKASSPAARWAGAGIDRTLVLHQPAEITITAQVCARLDAEPDARLKEIATSSPYNKPYWHAERVRIPGSRRVPVELLVNGRPVARTEITADGAVQPVQFTHRIDRSSWIALRIYPSSHTNPAWISLKNQPVRASRLSAAWCRKAVDVCWEQKRLRIRPAELDAASAAYQHARDTYDHILQQALPDGPAVKDTTIPPIFPVT
jgi:hypothetical protein